MCISSLSLKFCTCSQPTPKIKRSDRMDNPDWYLAQYNANNLVWLLERYNGKRDGIVIGSVIMPSQEVTPTLTNDFVLEQLNIQNCFDFEYIPHEGDNLIIRLNDKQKKQRMKSNPNAMNFLSFLYRNGRWEIGTYGLMDKTITFQKGHIHIIKPTK